MVTGRAARTAPRSHAGHDLDSDPAGVLAGWEPVRAPYSGLRAGLTEAEQRLNVHYATPCGEPTRRWLRLRQATGNETACASAVNDLAAAVLGGWQLAAGEDGRYRVHLVPAPDVELCELAAVQALVLLVDAGGWSRLGRCARPGCPGVFVDITSGGTRRVCRSHERNR